jgi:acetyl-CoA carboxylase beta subunit
LKEDSNIKYIKCPSCGKIFKKEQIGTRSGICLVCSVKDIHEEEYLKLLDNTMLTVEIKSKHND